MSRSQGARAISALLKRLPAEVSNEIVVEMNVTGREIAAEMRGRTPFRTGALRGGISYNVLPKSLKLQVGLLGTKAGRAALFYGRILDLGRKARTVQVTRRTSSGGLSSYAMNISPIVAKHFVTGRYYLLRNKMTANLRSLWERAITRASSGNPAE